jgi:small-conductance mechanosensitive channel
MGEVAWTCSTHRRVIIIITIIIITNSFTHGIYTYIPEKNHVPKKYNVAAILSLLFMVPISLVPALALMYFYISTFRSTRALPNMAVFCSSLTSWFPGVVLTYFLNVNFLPFMFTFLIYANGNEM